MPLDFEELDYQETPLGAISLRRRSDPRLGGEIIYEVKLGDEFLMSSRFTESETQLAKLALAAIEGSDLDVVVGGLGLGYTAVAALEHPSVRSLRVIEVMEPVLDWHRRGLVPLGGALTADPRCTLAHADFFEWALSGERREGDELIWPVHAVLLDIDHSPSHWLAPGNSAFYSEDGLRRLAEKLHPGGVFGMWSDDPPDSEFTGLLITTFGSCEPNVVTFPNPYLSGESSSTIYVART